MKIILGLLLIALTSTSCAHGSKIVRSETTTYHQRTVAGVSRAEHNRLASKVKALQLRQDRTDRFRDLMRCAGNRACISNTNRLWNEIDEEHDVFNDDSID